MGRVSSSASTSPSCHSRSIASQVERCGASPEAVSGPEGSGRASMGAPPFRLAESEPVQEGTRRWSVRRIAEARRRRMLTWPSQGRPETSSIRIPSPTSAWLVMYWWMDRSRPARL